MSFDHFEEFRRISAADRSTCQTSVNYQCESCIVQAENAFAPYPPTYAGANETSWHFHPERDGNNYGLYPDQCEAAFPGLYEDMERAVKTFRTRGLQITKKDLDENSNHTGTAEH